jgi:hypothetical protein
MPGAQCTRSLVCNVESTRVVTTSPPERPAFPHAMVLTVSFALSPVIGLSCHRHLADIGFVRPGRAEKTSARLDAGVEASGPHDFAVRKSTVRLRALRPLTEKSALRSNRARGHCRVHRIPPRVRDDHDTPLVGWDGESSKVDLGRARRKIFLQIGLDRQNHQPPADLPDGLPKRRQGLTRY